MTTDFPFPLPSRCSPDTEEACGGNLQWVQAWKLADTDKAVKRYRSWGMDSLAAYAYPEAIGADLELAANNLGWFTLFDDQFDGCLGGKPEEVSKICRGVLSVIDGRSPDIPEGAIRSLAIAFEDLWERNTAGMPTDWCVQFRHSWEETFDGFIQEAEDRQHHIFPSRTAYFRKRVRSLGAYVWCDLVERLEKCTVPGKARNLPVLEDLRRLHGEVGVMVNDAFSLKREEAVGDGPCNLIPLLQQEHGITHKESIQRLTRIAGEVIQEISRIQAQLPHISDRLLLAPEEKTRLIRYGTCLASMGRGNYDWSRQTLRYRATNSSSAA